MLRKDYSDDADSSSFEPSKKDVDAIDLSTLIASSSFNLTFREAQSLLDTAGLLDSVLQLRLQEGIAREQLFLKLHPPSSSSSSSSSSTASDTSSPFALAALDDYHDTGDDEKDPDEDVEDAKTVRAQAEAIASAMDKFDRIVSTLSVEQQIHRMQMLLVLLFRALTRRNPVSIMLDEWDAIDDISLQLSCLIAKQIDTCLFLGTLTSLPSQLLQDATREQCLHLKRFCAEILDEPTFAKVSAAPATARQTSASTTNSTNSSNIKSVNSLSDPDPADFPQHLRMIPKRYHGELIHFPLRNLSRLEMIEMCCNHLGADRMENEVSELACVCVTYVHFLCPRYLAASSPTFP